MNKVIWYLKTLRRYTNKSFVSKMDEVYPYYAEAKEKKISRKKLYWDMCYENVRSRILPNQYFQFDLYEKSEAEKVQFVSTQERIATFVKGKKNFFPRNKYERYLIFRDLFKREVLYVSFENEPDEEKAFQEFRLKQNQFVSKPALGTQGNGVQILDAENIPSLSLLREKVGGACLLEEVIKQGQELAVFHSKSINTIRLVTVMNMEKDIIPLFAIIRVGCGDSVVDNMGQGGIAALIDLDTGRICSDGIQSEGHFTGDTFRNHPDSGIRFDGYQIPDWDKLCEIAKRGHQMLPQQQMIGWDFAWTVDRGWDVVEANPSPAFATYQTLAGKGIRNTLVEAGVL